MSIGLGYLGTPESRAALGHAVHECALHGSDLVIVSPRAVGETPEFAADRALAEATLRSRTVTIQLVDSEHDLADALIDLSYEAGVELLVMGQRRRSAVGKLLLGSLTQRVILEARCPVTAVKPPVEPTG
ncbi:universal stress protein [uncultured Nocardioides sp.]|uniref:universal stress protein n=1 Tax=uncultured Nocardioides sp. TaxID=198441 RepID=UPI00261563AF|nr:universal stress protein [uncultured Nocardioides sp.]